MSQIRLHCRRGMLELDFIFEKFLNHHYDHLSDAQKSLFSRLLKEEDTTLYDWLVVDTPCPDVTLQPIIDVILKHPFNSDIV